MVLVVAVVLVVPAAGEWVAVAAVGWVAQAAEEGSAVGRAVWAAQEGLVVGWVALAALVALVDKEICGHHLDDHHLYRGCRHRWAFGYVRRHGLWKAPISYPFFRCPRRGLCSWS